MRSNIDEKRLPFSLMRWVIYFCILMLSVFSMWHFAEYFKEATFEEYGIVENLQLVALLLSGFTFFAQSFFKTHYRSLCLFLGSLCLTAFCRELDNWFDELWFLGWKFALIIPVFSVIYILHHLTEFRKSLTDFCFSSSFFMMYTVAIITLPVAQCVGHKNFFVDALGPITDPRLVRRLFEESVEYVGYILLFLSSIEFYIDLVRKAPKHLFKK